MKNEEERIGRRGRGGKKNVDGDVRRCNIMRDLICEGFGAINNVVRGSVRY